MALTIGRSSTNNTSDGPSNDRLKKAIERNRLKRMQREAKQKYASTSSQRRETALPSTIEFTEKPGPFSLPKLSYAKSKKSSSKSLQIKKFGKWSKFLVMAFWLFALFLCLRLVFISDGIIDYLSMQDTLEQKAGNIQYLLNENDQLKQEIKDIKSNGSYQKKLAREHLGVIAEDEYLVMFGKEQSQ